MKPLTIICGILAIAIVAGDDKYDSKYDNFDIGAVLSNRRLLQNYVNCLLDKGPCTAEAKSVKDRLPEALATNCAKCTPDQKTLGKKVALAVMRDHPDYWSELAAKYDPDGKYHVSFQEYLKS